MTKQNFYKNILLLLGLFYIFWLFWARFLRERLPKDVPYFLTEERFIILVYICLIYFIIILSFFKKQENNKNFEIFKKFTDKIFMPIILLDTEIKLNKFILPKITKNLFKISHEIISFKNIFNYYSKDVLFSVYFIFNILPRLFLASLLLMDIFVFKRIDLFYGYIFISIIPLIHRYIKYSLKNISKIFEKNLNKWDIYLLADESDLEKSRLDFIDDESFDKYIKEEYQFHEEKLTIKAYLDIVASGQYSFYNYGLLSKTNEPIEDCDKILFEKYRLCFLTFSTLFESYQKIEDSWNVKALRIFAFSLYLGAWSSVLVKSFHTLEGLPFTFYFLNNFLYNMYENMNIFI